MLRLVGQFFLLSLLLVISDPVRISFFSLFSVFFFFNPSLVNSFNQSVFYPTNLLISAIPSYGSSLLLRNPSCFFFFYSLKLVEVLLPKTIWIYWRLFARSLHIPDFPVDVVPWEFVLEILCDFCLSTIQNFWHHHTATSNTSSRPWLGPPSV